MKWPCPKPSASVRPLLQPSVEVTCRRGDTGRCALRVSASNPSNPKKIVSSWPRGPEPLIPVPASFADQSRAQRRAQLIGEGRDESNGQSNSTKRVRIHLTRTGGIWGKAVVEAQDEVDGQLDSIRERPRSKRPARHQLDAGKAGQGLRQALNDVDDIDENMDQAEYHIQRMELCCCVTSAAAAARVASQRRRTLHLAVLMHALRSLCEQGCGPAPSRGRRGAAPSV